jgi:hypothetical protein
MATNKEKLEDHENRLQGIENQLGLTPPLQKKTAWKHMTWWIKSNPWISIPLSIILAVFTLFAAYWLDHHNEWWTQEVDVRVGAVLEKPGGVQETLKQVRDTVNRTDEKLKTLEPFIQNVVKHEFEDVSKLPTSALIQRLPAFKNLVAVAKSQNIVIDPLIITQVGAKLGDNHDADAWDALLQLVDYKSFNNTLSSSLPDTTNVAAFRDKYVINIPSGGVHPAFSLKGSVLADIAAQTNYIGKDSNEGMVLGPAWIVAEGGEVGLAGIQLRNIVFRNVRISYVGGPLIMKNVYFVNCTFKMEVNPTTRQLAFVLLAPTPSISFHSVAGPSTQS